MRKIPRRDFLKAAAAAAPLILPATAWGRAGRPSPGERITLGCIGMGGQGQWDMQAFLALPEVQVVAVCDVDAGKLAAGRRKVESHYTAQQVSGPYSGCAAYEDHRALLAREDIDAVLIATPDHWHALMTIEAARSGKDIYCEKPLSYSFAEGRAMVDAVRRYKRVLQTGTQRRSSAVCRRACELVRNGRIGRLHTIRVGLPKGFAIRGGYSGHEPPMPVPDGFNYDLWLGPAPWVPYTEGRCHFNFRWIVDYGEGYISDWGAHYLDVGQMGHGTDRSGPVKISAQAVEFLPSGFYDAPVGFHIDYDYADGVRMIGSTKEVLGMRFEGDEGWIHVERPGASGLEAEPASVLDSVIRPEEIHLPRSPGHHQNFMDCVRSRAEPVAPAEVGHRSATICHLGMIAALLGRDLHWDPDRECLVGDSQAARMLSRPMREPWQL